MNDLISVIVPVYKVEQYLKKCIDSILEQTYYNLEIILVDDGSPDNCGAICDEYAKKDSRIRVIHKNNGGLSDARNAGLDIMTGEYVAFVDSDDWIEPTMYEKLLTNMKHFQADISFGGVADDVVQIGAVKTIKVSDYGKEPFVEDKTETMKRVLQNGCSAWDKIYRADLFDNVRFPVGEFNEDEAIILHLLNKCQRSCFTGEVFYHYMHRKNSGSLTKSSFSRGKTVWYDHCKSNLAFVALHYPELVPYAKRRYLSSLIWVLNNMTADTKQFSDLIPQYRTELQLCIKDKMWLRSLPTKERLRVYFLAYCYTPYAMALKMAGKHYT